MKLEEQNTNNHVLNFKTNWLQIDSTMSLGVATPDNGIGTTADRMAVIVGRQSLQQFTQHNMI